MDMVSRAVVRSVASTIVKMEKNDETEYNPASAVDVLNSRYKLVTPEQLPTLQQQVALEVVAERNAVKNTLSFNRAGVAHMAFHMASGNLVIAPTLDDPDAELQPA